MGEADRGARRKYRALAILLATAAVVVIGLKIFVLRSESFAVVVVNHSGDTLEAVTVGDAEQFVRLGTIADRGRAEAELRRALSSPLVFRYRRAGVEESLEPWPEGPRLIAVGSSRAEFEVRVGPDGLEAWGVRQFGSLLGR